MIVNQKLAETEINKIDVKSQVEHQIQYQETKVSVSISVKISSVRINFCQTGDINGSIQVKNLYRSIVNLKIKNIQI